MAAPVAWRLPDCRGHGSDRAAASTSTPRRQRSAPAVTAGACVAAAVLCSLGHRALFAVAPRHTQRQPVVYPSVRGALTPSTRISLRAAPEESDLLGFVEFEPEREPIRYLDPLDFKNPEEGAAEDGFQTIPCFPLGGSVYVPDTTQVLNIFEPRYRQMYSDILLSGGRRFVVPQIEQDDDGVRLAEVGVIFYLDDLREVSEQTNDQVKYVCQHSVIGRVRLRKVLNPKAFADRTTYLRVEAEDLIDEDIDEDLSLDEEATMKLTGDVDKLQGKIGNEVRIGEAALSKTNATRTGFWGLVTLWQDQVHGRARLCQQRFQRELQETIVTYLKKTNSEIPPQVTLGELPEEVQKEVVALQDQFRDEIDPLVKAQTEGVQELVQCDSHKNRLALFRSLLATDKKRLEAKIALKSIFE